MPGELRPGAARLLGLFGSIQASAFAEMSTAEVWDELRDAASRSGFDLAGINAADVSQLRGIANEARNAMQAFSQASPGDAITGSMIFDAPWRAESTGGELLPSFRVRYALQVVDPQGNETLLWQSFTTTQLPGTVEGLLSDVTDVGAGDTANYGVTLTGVAHTIVERI